MSDATVYLVRHGMHDWLRPEHNRFAGAIPGIGLNEEGRLEVQRLAGLLSGEPMAWIAASPLDRTMETAEMLARAFHLDVAADERLVEWRGGAWEGMKIIEIERQYPSEWKIWRERPDLLRLPGAETVGQMAARMEVAYRSWAARGGTGVLVSHQDPLAALLCTLIGAPLRAMRAVDIQTASLSTVYEMPYGTVIAAINAGRPLA
jgi:broad specificity phosphatase PhoE